MSEVNLQFKLVREAQSNYGTNFYELVNTYGTPFTVRDVLMFVIGQNNWGIIEFVNPYIPEDLPRLVYSKTRFIKTDGRYSSDLGGYDRDAIWSAEVESAGADGGWSEMNYKIRLKDLSLLKPSNIVKKLNEDPDQLCMIPEYTKYIISAPSEASDADIRSVYNKIAKDLSLPKNESVITIPFGWTIRLYSDQANPEELK